MFSTVEPRQPHHADWTRQVPGIGGDRIRLRRRLEDYSYAKGSPAYATPTYAWDVLVDGVLMSSSRTKREAVAVAHSMSTAVN